MQKSAIARKSPTYRQWIFSTIPRWLEGKRQDDEAEGLWRIYDNLYDLHNFMDRHPGGRFWLEQTRGLDITEAFEIHHIRGVPEALLKKYFIRQASKPRNYVLTFDENGFYRTLKGRVGEHLKDMDYGPRKRTSFYHLTLLMFSLLLALISTRLDYIVVEVLTGLFLVWQAVAAHNYFHQRDNWQMYSFNLTLMNFADWRISHAMSHHIYTNSLYDLEMALPEPFLCWIPSREVASKPRRLLSLLLQPLVYALLFFASFAQRAVRSIVTTNELYWHDIIGFNLPALMWLCSALSPAEVLLKWSRIIMFASFIFSSISFNGAHHIPSHFHDGDALRSDRDWGIFQLQTITDRSDIKGNHFWTLTHFGDHILHHFFPTLDHGMLPQLYPILEKTLEEFKGSGGELRELSFLKHIVEQNRQLLRMEARTF
ncbi:cytochrome b5-related protein-like [Musca vetustissima]|uniref:cytochrome b5-related protein-like n=1 Tax=Musca vetustissima TaxID=27455 RepID=UPI002AB7AEA8|nr:cytochrome b5-related protein-like [Musca vetustissima]